MDIVKKRMCVTDMILRIYYDQEPLLSAMKDQFEFMKDQFEFNLRMLKDNFKKTKSWFLYRYKMNTLKVNLTY